VTDPADCVLRECRAIPGAQSECLLQLSQRGRVRLGAKKLFCAANGTAGSRTIPVSALLLAFFFVIAAGSAAAKVRYTISLSDPARHLVQVTMEIPLGVDARELQLPVWNALYQIRDFSQNMNWIRAEDGNGKSLKLMQLNKSRWKISGAECGARVQYEMRSDSPGPYGAQLNPHHAFFNLAEILLYADDTRNERAEVEFRNIPVQWKIATPLPQESGGGAYLAENYDRLVDSPVEIGTFGETDFTATCGAYRVVVDSSDATAVLKKIVTPIQRIVSAATDWMGHCPFQNYMFIYHVSESPGRGGMEHACSTAITLSEKDVSDIPEKFTGVTAHEFFHLWNVKRIRPQSLEPVDYTKENYTPSLWFSEGVDSTVGEYIRLRAGLLDESNYLDHLGQEITELENRPAHLTQSVEQASIDAWLEKYPYYGLPTRSISYYNKGELLGVLLDLCMRDASNDQATLRDLFRWMNDRYGKPGKAFADSEAVEHSAEMLSHADLREFFQRYVSGVDEIPWDSLFARVGLRVIKIEVALADPGFDAVQEFDQPPIVVEVHPGSQAEQSGLKTGDVILQINGQPTGHEFEAQIAKLGPAETLRLVVRREGAGHQKQLQWKLGAHKQTVFHLEDVPGITAQQKGCRAAWLFGPTEKSQHQY
jgi:predicted metalloprotease with PDZ domain